MYDHMQQTQYKAKLSMNGKNLALTAPPFVLPVLSYVEGRLSKDERKVFQQNQVPS